MKILSDTLRLLKRVRFEWSLKASIFQLLLIIISNLILSGFFFIILGITDQYHIDKGNFFTIIKNPFALVLFILYFLSLIAFINLEFYILYRIVADKKLTNKQ